jgi:hypothetical protein
MVGPGPLAKRRKLSLKGVVMNSPTPRPFTKKLADCAAMEYILLGDLRDILEEPLDQQNCKWLIAVLDALLETLPIEFHLKERGGYMAEVLDRYPNWSDDVEQLRREHRVLCATLTEFREQIVLNSPFQEMADEVRQCLRDWMNSLIAHNRHERRLLQTALNLEIGTGD